MSIEHARKHGPFDPRYPPPRDTRAPTSLRRLGEQRTDWQALLARFYPGWRRHDLDALAAYESYGNDAEGRGARSGKARRGRDGEAPGAAVEAERWEGEGGAVAGRPGRPRRGERRVAPQRV